jgi:hypothetical protein
MAKATEKATVKADKEVKQEKHMLQYSFTPGELQELGKLLGDKHIEKRTVEDQFKSIKGEWDYRIKALTAHISSLSNKTSMGFETREIECELTLNDPINKKTLRRLDTGEVVWIHDLTNEEKQRTLEFSEQSE